MHFMLYINMYIYIQTRLLDFSRFSLFSSLPGCKMCTGSSHMNTQVSLSSRIYICVYIYIYIYICRFG